MFSDTSSSISFGHEFVLQKRVRDIATKGFSTIDVPKASRATKKPPAKKIEPALMLIQDALFQQEEHLGGLATRLHHTVRLMERLYGKNDKAAISTLQKVKPIQLEFVHVLRVIAGMKAYEKHISLGHVSHKNVRRSLKEIERVPWNKKPRSVLGKDALMAMIDEKRYFPTMSATGKIEFSPKSPCLRSDIGSEALSTSTRSTVSSSSNPASPY